MTWGMGCSSAASKRYQRRILTAMSIYVVVLFACIKLVRTIPIHGWVLYVLAALPAIPVLAVLWILALYLREETDEYLRMLTMRSLIVAAGAMLATVVVNDFLRVFELGGALSPFVCFGVFFGAFGIAQLSQELASRRGSDD